MKKSKIGIIILMFLVLFQVFTLEVSAAEHKLEEQHIHVFINPDGSAQITEKRVAHLTEGTENYIVIGNLSLSKIYDFVVTENGQTYEYHYNWDINASRSEKAFKNGIIKQGDHYELSWGIGEYGRHEYTIEYKITNFIKQLKDDQTLFWRFVNDQTNIPPEEVTVVIESANQFSQETEKIWAFGYEGEINFENGKVVAKSDQPLDKSDYVTILIQFPDGMFQTNDHINKTFDEIKEEAFEGSDYGKEKPSEGVTGSFIKFAFVAIFILFIKDKLRRPSGYKLTKKRPKRFRKRFRGEYYRDHPYEGDMSDIYYILYIMGASNFEKLMTSYILKWVKENRIRVETEQVGFIRKREEAALYFIHKEMDHDSFEGELFHMMLSAAGSNDILQSSEFSTWKRKNHKKLIALEKKFSKNSTKKSTTGSNDILQSNEFSTWTRKNRKKLIAWEKKIIKNSTKKLENLGYIQLEKRRKFLFKSEDYELTTKGIELEENIHKFANYLRDYSLLNEHEAVNVKIWDELMIWAAILGLTTVVQKQFKEIYPDYVNESAYSGSSIYYASAFSRTTSSARAPRASSSSGGGGSSSSGGGGGSFGGGSGGGTR